MLCFFLELCLWIRKVWIPAWYLWVNDYSHPLLLLLSSILLSWLSISLSIAIAISPFLYRLFLDEMDDSRDEDGNGNGNAIECQQTEQNRWSKETKSKSKLPYTWKLKKKSLYVHMMTRLHKRDDAHSRFLPYASGMNKIKILEIIGTPFAPTLPVSLSHS